MTDIPIPPEAVEAAAQAIQRWVIALVDNDTRATELLDEERVIIADRAIAAAINAWPGMAVEDVDTPWPPRLILPLPQETRDE